MGWSVKDRENNSKISSVVVESYSIKREFESVKILVCYHTLLDDDTIIGDCEPEKQENIQTIFLLKACCAERFDEPQRLKTCSAKASAFL